MRVGEDGIFPFPAPPMPVADYAAPAAPKKKVAPVEKPEEVANETSEEPTGGAAKVEEAPKAEDAPAATSSDDAEPSKEDNA